MIRKTYRGLLRVQLLSTFVGIAGMLVDSLMVGQFLGGESIAAYGLVSPILLIFTSISSALAVGAQNRAAGALGRGDPQKANTHYMTALISVVGAGILCTVLIAAFARPISVLLGAAEGTLLSDTKDYLTGYVLSVPATAFLMISLPFVQLDGDGNCAMVATVVKTVLDILFDAVVIFVLKEGMFFIGLGSALSAYIADLFVLFHFRGKNRMFRLTPSSFQASELPGILKNGVPNCLSGGLWTCMMLIMNKLAMANGGVTSVAALTVTMSLYNILVINGTANNNVITMMVATTSAESDYGSLKEVVKTGFLCTFLGNAAVSLLAFVFAKPLASLYTQDAAVLAAAAVGIRFIAIRVLNCPCGILRNIFLGMQRLRPARIMTACSSFVALALPAILYAALWGMTGVWLAFVTADIFVTLGVYIVFSLRKGHILPKIEDYLIAPGTDHAQLTDAAEFTVRSRDELMEAARKVEEYCKDHGSDLVTRLHASLMIEELGTNVLAHGFGGTMGPDDFLKVRVFYREEHLILSLKDNANAFDPTKYVSQFTDSSPEDCLGLRMIMKLSSSVKYTYTYGFNSILAEV